MICAATLPSVDDLVLSLNHLFALTTSSILSTLFHTKMQITSSAAIIADAIIVSAHNLSASIPFIRELVSVLAANASQLTLADVSAEVCI